MKTKWITRDDVLDVARRLKMEPSDEIIRKVLVEYDDYRTQYPTDNWTEIVETMLYDYTGPVLRYVPTPDTTEPYPFHTDGDGDDDVNLNFLG